MCIFQFFISGEGEGVWDRDQSGTEISLAPFFG